MLVCTSNKQFYDFLGFPFEMPRCPPLHTEPSHRVVDCWVPLERVPTSSSPWSIRPSRVSPTQKSIDPCLPLRFIHLQNHRNSLGFVLVLNSFSQFTLAANTNPQTFHHHRCGATRPIKASSPVQV